MAVGTVKSDAEPTMVWSHEAFEAVQARRDAAHRAGAYRLDDVLWSETGAVVSRGRRFDPVGFQRPVLLVTLTGSLRNDPAGELALRSLARRLGSVEHPHVARLLDLSSIDGSPAVVIEHVDGRGLSDVLRYAPLPPLAAVQLLVQITHGITALHDAFDPQTGSPAPLTLGGLDDHSLVLSPDGRAKLTPLQGVLWLNAGDPTNDLQTLGRVAAKLLGVSGPALNHRVRAAAMAAFVGVDDALAALMGACLEPDAALRPTARAAARQLDRITRRLDGPGLAEWVAQHPHHPTARSIDAAELVAVPQAVPGWMVAVAATVLLGAVVTAGSLLAQIERHDATIASGGGSTSGSGSAAMVR